VTVIVLNADDGDDDDSTPVICGACDGTGEAGRFGQLVCRPCKGSGEVMPGVSFDDFDDWYDGSDREHAEYLRSDR
jgi:RecJ-like exonuclease